MGDTPAPAIRTLDIVSAEAGFEAGIFFVASATFLSFGSCDAAGCAVPALFIFSSTLRKTPTIPRPAPTPAPAPAPVASPRSIRTCE